MGFKSWEYVLYVFVTTFLLLAGFFLVMAGLLNLIPKLGQGRYGLAGKLVLVGLVLLAGATGYLYYNYVRVLDLGGRTISLVIKPGDDFRTVSRFLVSQGAVPSPWLIGYAARWRAVDRRLTPGEYDFSGKVSVQSILERLRRGEIETARFTIYEGAPIWQVAAILAKALHTDSAALMSLSTDRRFLDSLGLPYLEGYLFPDTYVVPRGIGLRPVVAELVRTFRRRTDSLFQQSPHPDLTPQEVVVLASIVQAETPLLAELPKVASVYWNRLRGRMKLDADPTVIYGLGGLERPLLKRDLEVLTPYNTYRLMGLPPTPINSPGLAAIQAALRPESTGFLYFVADGSGGHLFAYTNDEHNRNRMKVKQAQTRN